MESKGPRFFQASNDSSWGHDFWTTIDLRSFLTSPQKWGEPKVSVGHRVVGLGKLFHDVKPAE